MIENQRKNTALAPDVENYLLKKESISSPLELPNLETFPREYLEIAGEIANLTGSWNPVEFYTPSNAAKEKSKFLEMYKNGEIYNPVFQYDHALNTPMDTSRTALFEIKSKLAKLQPENDFQRLARAALYFKTKDDLATTSFVMGIQNGDEKMIREGFMRKYPGTDDVLLQKSEALYEEICEESPETPHKEGMLTDEEKKKLRNTKFNSEQIKDAFEWGLKNTKMRDGRSLLRTEDNDCGFKVKVDVKATSIDVRDKSVDGSTIFIPEGREINGEELLRLINHELGGHVFQSINGQELFGIGGGALKVDNEMHYEGLGMRYEEEVAEDLFGEKFPAPLPYYAFAVKAAEEGRSFYEIFADQVNKRLHSFLKIHPDASLPSRESIDDKKYNASLNSAWLTTLRVMRGHLDTSNQASFAMAKDLGYLRGWLIDKNLRDNDLGFLNEAGIIASGALQLIAHFKIEEKDLPVPFNNIAKQYWELVLKPELFPKKKVNE